MSGSEVTPLQPFVQFPEGSRVAPIREARGSAVVVEPFELGVLIGDLKFQVGHISGETELRYHVEIGGPGFSALEMEHGD